MCIGMGIMVLALTGAGTVQVWLQRMPETNPLGFMATQDELRIFYWVRVGGGVMFLVACAMAFSSSLFVLQSFSSAVARSRPSSAMRVEKFIILLLQIRVLFCFCGALHYEKKGNERNTCGSNDDGNEQWCVHV